MSFYSRYFFKCRDCGFMLSLLAQANKEITGCCPSCGEDMDYAPKKDWEKYIEDIKFEIANMDDED
jgi:transcription initiation factor IIE alpha subunit